MEDHNGIEKYKKKHNDTESYNLKFLPLLKTSHLILDEPSALRV